MGFSDNVAVVALVVSLIALVTALFQMFQQVFLTADGYRNCAEEVIGPWSTTRHRRFNWRELRLETTYITPELTIIRSDILRGLEKRDRPRVCGIASARLAEARFREIWRTVHVSRDVRHALDRHLQLGGTGELASPLDKFTLTKLGQVSTWADLSVSWLRLLDDIHSVYTLFGPSECAFGCPLKQDDTASEPARYGQVRKNAWQTTEAAVVYRHRNWDFMPPDLQRPLASSDLGSIVVLALRLGMQWRAIDPANAKLLAGGNGYSLNATELKGFGIVLTFSKLESYRPPPPYVPSVATEQLMCGIVPADIELISVVDGFGVVEEPTSGSDGISICPLLEAFGVPKHIIASIDKGDIPEAHNEAIILTCPFLPLPGLSTWKIVTSLFTSGTRSVLWYWEGRLALLRRLEDRIHATDKYPIASQVLIDVRDKLRSLQDEHPCEFFNLWQKALITSRTEEAMAPDQLKKRLQFLDTLREMFEWTTKHFVDGGWNISAGDVPAQYARLIGAHMTVSTIAIKRARAAMENDALRHRDYGLKYYQYYGFVQSVYETGRAYSEIVSENDDVLVDAMNASQVFGGDQFAFDRRVKKQSINGTGGGQKTQAGYAYEDLEEAWWVMMLRGIVWTMSIWVESPGQPIPSWVYENRTPVWIT